MTELMVCIKCPNLVNILIEAFPNTMNKTEGVRRPIPKTVKDINAFVVCKEITSPRNGIVLFEIWN